MRFRLGPLGTPLAILFVWVAARVAVQEGEPVASDRPIVAVRKPDDAASPSRVRIAEPPLPVEARFAIVERTASARKPEGPTSIAQAMPDTSLAISTAFAKMPPPQPPPALRSGVVAGWPGLVRANHRPFTGSAWALINGTGGAVGVPSLGGSQAGVRLFLQGERAPLALTARVSHALGGSRDTEVSAGYALRAQNAGLLVERRERVDAEDGAFVLTGYGGAYDVRLPGGLRFNGFAQAGVAGLRSRRWFADGQARVTGRAPVAKGLSLGAGGGAWASAQQGARRVEAGPVIEARIRSGAVGMRVAGEYRLRLTGNARPRSGPALTIGVDF